MQAGRLNSRIALMQRGNTVDELGQPVESWTKVADLWADIRFLSGVESLKADAVVSVARASVRIRYRESVTAAMRLHYGTTVFEIKAVLPKGREWVDLACEVVT